MISTNDHRLAKNRFLLMAIITVVIEVVFFLTKPFITRLLGVGMPLYLFMCIPICVWLVWFILIVRDSRLFKTVFGYLLIICAVAYGLGLLAKLEHWWWASYALIVGSGAALIIYTIRFIVKKGKRILDYLKFLFLIAYFIISMMILEHYLSIEFKVIYNMLFYVMIFLFARKKDAEFDNEQESFSFEKDEHLA